MLKVFNLIALFLSISSSLACKLDSSNKYLSLSAPITHVIEELGLLNSPALDAVSVFHPVENNKVEKIAGGVFLSPKYLNSKKKHIVFFDASRELERALKKAKIEKRLKLDTNGVDSFEVNDLAVKTLLPFLNGCDEKISKLSKKAEMIKSSLKRSFLKGKKLVFFLGKIKKDRRPPRLVIANDGFVLALKKYAEIISYPSELAYVSRSEKVLKDFSPYISIGVFESDEFELKTSKVKAHTLNATIAGVLSPGWKQVEFIKALLEDKQFKEAL